MHEFTDRTWLWFASALYFAGFVLGTIGVLRDQRLSRASVYVTIALGFLVQTFGMYLRGLAVHGCPIGNTFEIFQFTAWSATALYLVIGPTFRLSLLGYFACCLSAALTLVSLSVPSWDAVLRVNLFGGSPWIEFHAALALFSYGVFGLLGLTSTMYLLQFYSLKNRNLRGFFAFLPSIVDLDHISYRLLTFGVVLMTASLLVGSRYWLMHSARVEPVKMISTVVVWFAYATALTLRWRGVLIAKRLAIVCISLFVAALLSLGPVSYNFKNVPQRTAPGPR